MAELKNYRLVNQEGVGRIVVKNSIIELQSITEEQAQFLFESGSRYVEKVEPLRTIRTSTQKRTLASP